MLSGTQTLAGALGSALGVSSRRIFLFISGPWFWSRSPWPHSPGAWSCAGLWCPHPSLRKLGFVFSSVNSLPICNVRLFDDSDLQPAWPRDIEALPGHFAAFPSHPAFCCQTAQTCVCSDIHLGEGDTSRGLGTNLGMWGGSPHPMQSTVTVAEPRLPLSAARQANKSGGKLWGLEIMTSIEKLANWENGRLVSQKTHLVLVWIWAPFSQKKGKKQGLPSTDSRLSHVDMTSPPSSEPSSAYSRWKQTRPTWPCSFHIHRESIWGSSGGTRVVAQPGLSDLGLPALPLGPSRQMAKGVRKETWPNIWSIGKGGHCGGVSEARVSGHQDREDHVHLRVSCQVSWVGIFSRLVFGFPGSKFCWPLLPGNEVASWGPFIWLPPLAKLPKDPSGLLTAYAATPCPSAMTPVERPECRSCPARAESSSLHTRKEQAWAHTHLILLHLTSPIISEKCDFPPIRNQTPDKI